ncbi:MAG: ABC transporter permease [Clostridia bacterium]|nr:ABC transporter permease [Clostridia bacterium]
MRRFADTFVSALKGLWRNGVVSLVSVFVLISCLLFVGSFGLVALNVTYNFDDVSELNEIEVFLEFDASADTVERVEREILRLDNIESVVFVSKQDGLNDMKGEFSEYGHLFDDIGDEENPLSDKFRVVYTDNERVTTLDYELKQIEGVRKVNSRLDIAATVGSLESGITLVFIWFTIILTVVCMLVVYNTIRLSVYARREEIAIMRYIGASRAYIAAPFVIEGMVIGVLGAVVAFFIEEGIYAGLSAFVTAEMGVVKLYTYGETAPLVLGSFLVISLLCAVVGSLASMGRYAEK